MDGKDYFWLTRKKEPKTKPKSRPLPKAKQKYLEAEATLKEELEDLAIGFESKFQPIHTKHWRFDFHIVKLRLLIEIEGGPWSGGRGGKLANKAWSLDRYDQAEEMGYRYHRFEVSDINMGRATTWLRNLKASYGTVQTIPADGAD